jgi:hypothetical protein
MTECAVDHSNVLLKFYLLTNYNHIPTHLMLSGNCSWKRVIKYLITENSAEVPLKGLLMAALPNNSCS